MHTQRINLQLFAEASEQNLSLAEMQRKITVMKSIDTYMDVLEMSRETAQQYAEARADGDADKENEILRQHIKTLKSKMMQGFLKSRPGISAGHGNAETETKATRFIKSLPIYNNEVDESILKQYM